MRSWSPTSQSKMTLSCWFSLSSRISGAPVGHGLRRVDDRRERLVLDVDRLAGVLGDVGVVGDDAGDLLALEADLVGGQHGLGVVAEGGHPGEVAGRHHLAGEHQPDARDLVGLAGVDAGDPGVGERAAEDLHVQHARQHHVVDVVAAAADEAVVLDPAAARAHPADLDLVERPALGDGHLRPPGWRRRQQLLGRRRSCRRRRPCPPRPVRRRAPWRPPTAPP